MNLKFRAFRKGAMNGPYTLQEYLAIASGFTFDLNDSDPYVWMQYTGLMDRDGVEIYHYDIIEVYNWGKTTRNKLLGMTKVIWCHDDCGWRYANNSLTEDFYDQFRNVRVVGNIFENPDLLDDYWKVKNAV